MSTAVDLSPPSELTVEHLAAMTGDQPRTVRERVASWFARQLADSTLPRVRRSREFAAGRPRYLVDAASYDAWVASGAREEVLPIGAAGCLCGRCEIGGRPAAMLVQACPLHGGLL